jgi:hypothetical protein
MILFAVSCGDPVHEQRLAALGDEAPGVPAGPLHRPGQPCGVCHGPDGPAARAFAIAGSVYHSPSSDEPLGNVTVRLLDASGTSYATDTNCAGNFYLPESEVVLHYPVWVRLERGDERVEMRSAISRETSCAGCHARPASPRSAGQIYWFADDAAAPQGSACD